MSDSASTIEVVAAVITRPEGSFLLTCRPEGKPYAGYWEFPGGKVEEGESFRQALDRELQEELGIQILSAAPGLLEFLPMSMPSYVCIFIVSLHGKVCHVVVRIRYFLGSLLNTSKLSHYFQQMCPYCVHFQLPSIFAITHASEIGIDVSMVQIEHALQQGVKLVQVREKEMDEELLCAFSKDLVTLAHTYGASVLINGDIGLANDVGADGVHMTSSQLMTLSHRPGHIWCGASCHNAEELFQAEQLGMDFVVLGPGTSNIKSCRLLNPWLAKICCTYL